MKVLTIILVSIALIFGGVSLYDHYQKLQLAEKEGPAKKAQDAAAAAAAAADTIPPGMPSDLESKYAAAQGQGAMGIKNFLTKYGTKVRDPRLAAIQLDYVVLIASKDIAEARKMFAEVKKRVPRDSVVYARVQQLAKTYE